MLNSSQFASISSAPTYVQYISCDFQQAHWSIILPQIQNTLVSRNIPNLKPASITIAHMPLLPCTNPFTNHPSRRMAFGMPHSMVRILFGSRYDHFQHELVRMYGALTLAQVLHAPGIAMCKSVLIQPLLTRSRTSVAELGPVP